MKPAYNHFELSTGAHVGGVCRLQICPKEWITAGTAMNFLNGTEVGPITLDTGKQWLTLELTDDTFQFVEKPKESRFGAYFETSISGLFNDYTPAIRQQLESIRYHEVVAIITERNKSKRIVGSPTKGLKLNFGSMVDNGQGGKKEISIELRMDADKTAPYYTE